MSSSVGSHGDRYVSVNERHGQQIGSHTEASPIHSLYSVFSCGALRTVPQAELIHHIPLDSTQLFAHSIRTVARIPIQDTIPIRLQTG